MNTPIKLSIYDTFGNLIRSYSSDEKPEKLPVTIYFDKRWIGKKAALSTQAGMHRFVWDLRFPRPKALQYEYSIAAVWTVGTPIVPLGPLVMPGIYKIVLSVNGKDYIKELTVKLDPRIKISTSDLLKQLVLAQQIQKTSNSTVDLYDNVNNEIKNDSGNLPHDTLENLKQLKTKIANVSRIISGLASSIQTADAAPTQGQNNLYNEYKKQFEELEKKWEEINK